MTAHRSWSDPDESEVVETIVLDDESVMDTDEFKNLVAVDPDLLDEIGPPDIDD